MLVVPPGCYNQAPAEALRALGVPYYKLQLQNRKLASGESAAGLLGRAEPLANVTPSAHRRGSR